MVASLGGECVLQTKRILTRDHNYSHIERIWGPGDGRPVDELKSAIDSLILEFLVSRDVQEAERCVRELRAAHFHHEVYRIMPRKHLHTPVTLSLL